MPQGLQTWNADGKLMLDATYRIGRILDTFVSGTSNSSRVVPGLSGAGDPFHFVTVDIDYFTEIYCFPTVTFSGGTVSWVFNDFRNPLGSGNAPRKSATISVGVF